MLRHELETIVAEPAALKAIREAAALPPTTDYILEPDGAFSASHIKDGNSSGDKPSLWCPWEALSLTFLGIPHESKHYNYIEWLVWMIVHIFKPWGVTLEGEVQWYGEDREDVGRITVNCNGVYVANGTIAWTDSQKVL